MNIAIFRPTRASLAPAALLAAAWWLSPAAGVQAKDFSSLRSGAEVYTAACAACHGARGTGADRSARGFEEEPPDFTDCKFTSREQVHDWVGVATEGGPVKGFSPMMPAFGGALTPGQIAAAAGHAKSFCPEPGWPPGEFNLPKALNTGKAFPEDEVLLKISSSTSEPVELRGTLVVAGRLGARHQIEAIVPAGASQLPDGRDGTASRRWGGGAGDIGLAWKGVLWHDLPRGTIGSMALDVFLPTGDEADGMSKGLFAFEPALAIAQIVPRVGFLQLQGGAELSTHTGRSPHALFWRTAAGRTFKSGGFGRSWSPMVEILGGTTLADGAAVDWDIVPQLQVALSRRQHVRLGAGVAFPLTGFDDRAVKAQAYLVWDWYDGGIDEGW
jgi:mono/diheme cytochrome c family protein